MKDLFYSKLSADDLAEMLYNMMILRGEQPEVAQALVGLSRKVGRSKLATAIQGQQWLLRQYNSQRIG